MDEYYLVTAWVWNPNKAEYEYTVLRKTEDRRSAEEKFNEINITRDVAQVMIELNGEDWVDRLWVKDSTGVYAEY